MKRNLMRVLSVLALFACFVMVAEVSWAFKNSCPICNKVIEDQELTTCPSCGKVINKCLICGTVNPIKNDHCSNCDANLAESRVMRTISPDVRQDLKLGESPRAKIEVELGQIEQRTASEGATPELAARQVELLTQMGWWSEANLVAKQFTTTYPTASQTRLVNACRGKALRNLGFLAMEIENNEGAIEYLDAALALNPKDKVAQNLRQMAGGAK